MRRGLIGPIQGVSVWASILSLECHSLGYLWGGRQLAKSGNRGDSGTGLGKSMLLVEQGQRMLGSVLFRGRRIRAALCRSAFKG
jgi:hypothetical protein